MQKKEKKNLWSFKYVHIKKLGNNKVERKHFINLILPKHEYII